MSTKTHVPFFRWSLRALTGRGARRIYAYVLVFLLCLTTADRLRSYFMARKIQAVLKGLAEIRLDQTTEEQMTKTVPYLIQKDRKVGGMQDRGFYVKISNEKDWLGYRFMSFDASLLVQDGKVSQVEYGLANQWGRPEYAGYAGYIVSARSVHGFWLPGQIGLKVTSVDDDSRNIAPRSFMRVGEVG